MFLMRKKFGVLKDPLREWVTVCHPDERWSM